MSHLKFYGKFLFPTVMVAIMLATVLRYSSLGESRTQYNFVVEVDDVNSVMKAIQDATNQPVRAESLSDGRYVLVVRCPSDSVGLVAGIIQRLGCKRTE
jgi:hypothetical protein